MLRFLPAAWSLLLVAAAAPAQEPVSFHRQLRPILQRQCQGCHQPARDQGGLVLTTFEGFARGGSNGPAWVAGKPEASRVLGHLRGAGGRALMPPGETPLPSEQVELFARWIAQGARDDTPPEYHRRLAAGAPTVYAQPLAVTALAYSPDGSVLAVAGYREVLLHLPARPLPGGLPVLGAALAGLAVTPAGPCAALFTLDAVLPGRTLVARLGGLSERIETLAFSPNGELLLAAGGSAGRFGELQFWDWKRHKLVRSLLPSHDTVYGACFSADGQRVSFGCADNSARVVEVASGKQLVRLDHHLDWVFGTALSLNGKQIVTASRDRSVKMSETDTGTLLGNVTTHDPNQLGGGLRGLVRRPGRDEYLVAGEDGVPQLYRGTVAYNANLLRNYPRIEGRIEALAFSADGRFLAAAGSGGVARVYDADGGTVTASLPVPSAVFTAAFHPGGKQLALAGRDGKVRLFSLPDGRLAAEFVPVPLGPAGGRE